ncbi:MAG: hypothetical protein COX62_06775 [Deltaproteobacteria bacterium CG_4_10_14_0_2_um_filter_43_8]|nr:MAG: hypothetical protein COV43_06685 [Deltaproteobacteria bacterium CG11_big_fil_rev_8_21_14_0_20_42_23]PJA19428.1 MAG: hypothetical protein COX62_06775 [Deltaproteobacteria bacterium CG_4_10_14_0_2_um_filter_43_8]PJC64106.1 MAG: hypothetical protein CO021_06025 [Deltaproteobacteria bacterium CG_4_9_14_0_2_um_filter_42_21]
MRKTSAKKSKTETKATELQPSHVAESAEQAFEVLVSRLSSQQREASSSLISYLRTSLKTHPAQEQKTYFSALDVLRDVLKSNDHLFLKRQQHYHLAATTDLPAVYANITNVRLAIDRLIAFISSRVRIGGKIEVGIAAGNVNRTPGVEVMIAGRDPKLKSIDEAEYMRRIYSSDAKEAEGSVLLACRQLLAKEVGRLWCDVGEKRMVEHRLFLPEAPSASPFDHNQKTYRYDIKVRNYAYIRKCFGIKKAEYLILHIEELVRSLVRHPIDVVLSNKDEGLITAIYESAGDGAESVASRISRRLANDHFTIGKKKVDVSFSYALDLVQAQRT